MKYLTRIAIWSSSLTSWRAPMSDHVTSGIVANPSLFADGWTTRNPAYIYIKQEKNKLLLLEPTILI